MHKHNFVDYPSSTNESSYFLKYYRVIVNSMPSPYDSDCYEFGTKEKMYFRSSCIDRCKANKLKAEYGQLSIIYLTDEPQNITMVTNYSNVYNATIDNAFGEQCKTVCPLKTECYTEKYVISLVKNLWHNPWVFFVAPDRPDLIYTHSPKILFEEFVSYIASYVSLWFGFSMIGFSNVIHICIKTVIKKSTNFSTIFNNNKQNFIFNFNRRARVHMDDVHGKTKRIFHNH